MPGPPGAGAGPAGGAPPRPPPTLLEFHSPHGVALLLFEVSALRRFLLRTYAMVPGGREDVTGVVERGLSALFGGV
ncbi:SsgA family sporulation/cell division regulator [Streptomyces sp. NPDC017256]|uniref:SsgA family sporulation/cell division regulator n=1 Tax=Streptomyces sp. NPDC017256 TaxID=3364990 RepID=UPI00378C8A28